jgi:HAE1 family hydrophobic/amphiphilic exporter-1
MPPAIPGLGSSGGFSFWLQDRGGRSVEFLDKNVRTFIEAARKRPELAGVATIFSASDPQVYANVDRDKALKQGVAVGDVYQTMQAFLGGLYVNQFNRFGRQWRCSCRPTSMRGWIRTISAATTCGTATGPWCRCRRW